MSENRLVRAESLLESAADLSPGDRATFLSERCADDSELRAFVERLLARHVPRESDLPEPDPSRTRPETGRPSASTVPDRIGPYVLRERIGTGGMGEVWKAEQTAPVRRTVALKLIKAGMDSRQVLARFEAERQALAMMDHPYIAKVFDAGVTGRGRPYFVMEHVPGIPITDYCDERRLDTEERLELFEKVCEGVQHAHRKAVIHRDIKPTNILVADVEGRPLPKIIDFGVAKATSRKLTEKTMHTALGQIIGTPEYMSPEQADLTCEDVDTRTDVYSLGVVLYELMAGGLPFERNELRRAGLEGILRLLRDRDPPRPSTKISTLGEKTTEIAKRRRTDPRHLAKELRGDVDWIVMRALEKDRNRRYGSAQELAQDVRRHLGHQPVAAGPPGAGYRARKFVRRHRIGVAFTAAGLVAVVAALVLVTLQNARIAAARDEAVLVTTSLQEMLASVNPSRSGPDVTVRQMLDRTATTLGTRFGSRPLVEAALRHTVGITYHSLGDYDRAEEHLRVAADLRRELLGTRDPRTIEAMTDLASAWRVQLRHEEAEALAREARETARRALGEDHPQTLASMSELAMVYVFEHRYEEAQALLLETLETSRRVLGEEDPETVKTLARLAITYEGQGRYEEYAAVTEECLEIRRRTLGEEHPATLGSLGGLAAAYGRLGRFDEAETLYREALAIQRRVLGEDHPGTLGSLKGIGETYYARGRYEEAEEIFRENLETARRSLGRTHPQTLGPVYSLVRTYERLGRYDDAEALLLETLDDARQAFGPEHSETQQLLLHLGGLYLQQRRLEKADAVYQDLLEMSLRVFGEDHRRTSGVRYDLACSLALQGRRSEAVRLLRDILHLTPGYLERSPLRDDPDLESLRGDPDFDAIVGEVKRRAGDPAGPG